MHYLFLASGLVLAFWIFLILVFVAAAYVHYWPVVVTGLLIMIYRKKTQ